MLLYGFILVFLSIPSSDYLELLLDDGELERSEFYRENYTLLDTVNVAKSSSSKNLIFIVMESMETSFINSEKYGDLIKELEEVHDNEFNFSDSETFGGGADIYGSENTISAIISKTTGTPQLFRRTTKKTILNRVQSIWDVLGSNGYYNVFIQGTDGDFEDKRAYLVSHGINVLYDMDALKSYWDLDEKYNHLETDQGVLFGAALTDKKILDLSKNILDTLSQRPNFSLTILTMETHFPHGFYNEACADKPVNESEDAILAATIKCASKDVRNFIEWVKKQDFYDNTEIVVVGDHLFAGKYLVSKEDSSRRWINLFVNSEKIPTNKKRQFTSFDIAPTLLESMGFEINNHRMGFGASLFSNHQTLLEKYGFEKLQKGMREVGKSIEYDVLNGSD